MRSARIQQSPRYVDYGGGNGGLRSTSYADPIEEANAPASAREAVAVDFVLRRVRFFGGFLQMIYCLLTLITFWFVYWFPLLFFFLSAYTVVACLSHFGSANDFAYSRTCGWSSFMVLKYTLFAQFLLVLGGFAQVFVGIYVAVDSDDYRSAFGIMSIVAGLMIVLLAGMTAKSLREVELYVVPLAVSQLERTDPYMLAEEDYAVSSRARSTGGMSGGRRSNASWDDGQSFRNPRDNRPVPVNEDWVAPDPRARYSNLYAGAPPDSGTRGLSVPSAMKGGRSSSRTRSTPPTAYRGGAIPVEEELQPPVVDVFSRDVASPRAPVTPPAPVQRSVPGVNPLPQGGGNSPAPRVVSFAGQPNGNAAYNYRSPANNYGPNSGGASPIPGSGSRGRFGLDRPSSGVRGSYTQ